MFQEFGDLLAQLSFAKIRYSWIAAFVIITKVVRQYSSKVIFSNHDHMDRLDLDLNAQFFS